MCIPAMLQPDEYGSIAAKFQQTLRKENFVESRQSVRHTGPSSTRRTEAAIKPMKLQIKYGFILGLVDPGSGAFFLIPEDGGQDDQRTNQCETDGDGQQFAHAGGAPVG